ncbi:hypothetical protein BS47DRAFT_1402700 [Hydnum rufescens UP504]|uniref:Uncharacterized protein n=1 Tax=Hydnum rufescens UP504 TaxID=1448309 RepID=A0A9P6ACM2_9AGAM|nr:hypothetical protein BS47DRAFT_1402700 [Hydnum rufescens UP504]
MVDSDDESSDKDTLVHADGSVLNIDSQAGEVNSRQLEIEHKCEFNAQKLDYSVRPSVLMMSVVKSNSASLTLSAQLELSSNEPANEYEYPTSSVLMGMNDNSIGTPTDNAEPAKHMILYMELGRTRTLNSRNMLKRINKDRGANLTTVCSPTTEEVDVITDYSSLFMQSETNEASGDRPTKLFKFKNAAKSENSSHKRISIRIILSKYIGVPVGMVVDPAKATFRVLVPMTAVIICRPMASSSRSCDKHTDVEETTVSDPQLARPMNLSKPLSQLAAINQATMHSPLAKDASTRDGNDEVAVLTARVPERAKLSILWKNLIKTQQMDWMKFHLPRTMHCDVVLLNLSSGTSNIPGKFLKGMSKVAAWILHKERSTLHEWDLEWLPSLHLHDGYGDVEEATIFDPQHAKPTNPFKEISQLGKRGPTMAYLPLYNELPINYTGSPLFGHIESSPSIVVISGEVLEDVARVALWTILEKEEQRKLHATHIEESERTCKDGDTSSLRAGFLTMILSVLKSAMFKGPDIVDNQQWCIADPAHVLKNALLKAQGNSHSLANDLHVIDELPCKAHTSDLYHDGPGTKVTCPPSRTSVESPELIDTILSEVLEYTAKASHRGNLNVPCDGLEHTSDYSGTAARYTRVPTKILKTVGTRSSRDRNGDDGKPRPEETSMTKGYSPLLGEPNIDRTDLLSSELVVTMPGKVSEVPVKVVLHSALHKEETHISYKTLRSELEHVHESARPSPQHMAIMTKMLGALKSAMLR